MSTKPMFGRLMWIRRKSYTLGGSKRKTKRREQQADLKFIRQLKEHNNDNED